MLLRFPRATGRTDELFTHPTLLKTSALPCSRTAFRAALQPKVKELLCKSGIKPKTWYEITGNLYGNETAFHVQFGASAYGRALTADEGFSLAEWAHEILGQLHFGVQRHKFGTFNSR
jgi:hypothetical protein